MDAETGDVLRTIPSEAVIRIAKMIVKMQGNAVETTA
ncbi:flagellar protein [Bordetella pertussis]|nr:flagellar protein [Bordetella pertussis]